LGAALSIVILFSISSTIVRVAAVFLEHTGLSREISRIQAMSALSGTGFTTSESELILQTPERRRILTVLIITGSIGLASVVATLVVGAFGIKETAIGVLMQLAAIALAIAFVRYVLFSSIVDELICGLAHAWLVRRMAHAPYTTLYQLDAENLLAEHTIAAAPERMEDWVEDLVVVGIRTNAGVKLHALDETVLADGARVVLAGPRKAHDTFSERHGKSTLQEAH
jgi:hypothetical protein